MLKKLIIILTAAGVLSAAFGIYAAIMARLRENEVLREMVHRLEAETRVAEVLVTDCKYDKAGGKYLTTIKFLEFDSFNRPLPPRYFTFAGNIIQFQSLVIRFDDSYVKEGDPLRGKSLHLFWKVFMLDGANTVEYEITKMNTIPPAYNIEEIRDKHEEKIWKEFWSYVTDPDKAKAVGIKSAQIEAPGTLFVPGTLYTIKIEHDGGLRIDSAPIPEILRGERIL